MNQKRKREFIVGLIGNIEKEILEHLPKMPEEWDGIELRWYVKECFSQVAFGGYEDKRKRRYKDYQNYIFAERL